MNSCSSKVAKLLRTAPRALLLEHNTFEIYEDGTYLTGQEDFPLDAREEESWRSFLREKGYTWSARHWVQRAAFIQARTLAEAERQLIAAHRATNDIIREAVNLR